MEIWIYLASVLDTVGIFLVVVGLFGSVISAGLYIANKAYEKDHDDGVKVPWAKYTFVVCLITLCLSCFVPSKDTVYAMMAVHYGQEVVNNERVTNITNNSLDLLDAWIDKEREKLKEEK